MRIQFLKTTLTVHKPGIHLCRTITGTGLLVLFLWLLAAATATADTVNTPTAITVSGFSGSFDLLNGTYNPTSNPNEWAKDLVVPNSPAIPFFFIRWSGTRWELITNNTVYAYSEAGTVAGPPCEGWISELTATLPTLSGGCITTGNSAGNVTVANMTGTAALANGTYRWMGRYNGANRWATVASNGQQLVFIQWSDTGKRWEMLPMSGGIPIIFSYNLSGSPATLPCSNWIGSSPVLSGSCTNVPPPDGITSLTFSGSFLFDGEYQWSGTLNGSPVWVGNLTSGPLSGQTAIIKQSGGQWVIALIQFGGSDITFATNAGCAPVVPCSGWQLSNPNISFNLNGNCGGRIINPSGTLPLFVSQPACGAGTSICAGATVTIPASVSNATSYQWYKDNLPISGQTSATLTITNAQTAVSGIYSLSVGNVNGAIISNAYSVTVNPVPANPVLSSGTLTCAQTSVTLTASATGATSFSFSKGTKSGINQLIATQTGTYTVTAASEYGCSATATNTVYLDNTAPTPSLTASQPRFCTGGSLTLTAGGGVSYRFSGPGLTLTGASATAVVSQGGTYSVAVTGTNGCSAATALSVNEDLPVTGFSVSSQTVCPNATATLQATGCPNGIIQWPGATAGSTFASTGTTTRLVTATCTVGACTVTATGSAVVSGSLPLPAQILSLTADESACPVRLVGRGIASSFTMTGTNGYVFTTVFREAGTYEAIGLNVKKPGTYTLTTTLTNQCGTSAPVSQTISVGRNCP